MICLIANVNTYNGGYEWQETTILRLLYDYLSTMIENDLEFQELRLFLEGPCISSMDIELVLYQSTMIYDTLSLAHQVKSV